MKSTCLGRAGQIRKDLGPEVRLTPGIVSEKRRRRGTWDPAVVTCESRS